MKYLIMHGSYGSPEENWFRWLEKELVSLGHTVILEQFPSDNWDDIIKIGNDKRDSYTAIQTLASWEKYFVDHILPKIKDEEIGFIGHSIASSSSRQSLSRHFSTSQTHLVFGSFTLSTKPFITTISTLTRSSRRLANHT